MKGLAIVMAMMLAVSVGGCNVHKKPEAAKKQDRAEQVVKKETVDSLTARVGALSSRTAALEGRVVSLEKSRAAARAAFQQRQIPVSGF